MKSKRWTQKDIDDAIARRGISNNQHLISTNANKISKSVIKLPKQDPKALGEIKQKLLLLKIDFVTEYTFHPTRKFRFDIALINPKIAIEYEGIVSEKSRHTGIVGYTNDCRKYNLAQSLGWKVLRYTSLNSQELLSELSKIIKIE
jgi:hypothetical protein